MHSKCDEWVVLALAAIDVASDAIAADVETSAVLRVPRPAATVDTSAGSDMVIRTQAATAWASEASPPTTMVYPTAFARDVSLEYLNRMGRGGASARHEKWQTQNVYMLLNCVFKSNGKWKKAHTKCVSTPSVGRLVGRSVVCGPHSQRWKM